MSPAGELRAALEENLDTAVLVVVSNAGDTTHEEVLAAGLRAKDALSVVLSAVLAHWGALG